MAIVKRFWFATCVVALTACAKPAPNPTEAATECIRQQVPEGTTVSVAKAQDVLQDCGSLLDEWSRFSIEGTLGRPFDASDKKMMTAFIKHQEAARRYWLRRMSTGYAGTHRDFD